MIDLDAHRRILAWAVAAGRMSYSEYNALIANLKQSEWTASQCLGKESFSDITLAQRVASMASSRHAARILPYKCSKCGSYHIGNKTSRRVA